MVLLGQTINKVASERRLTILSTLTDVKTAKKDIIENSEDMGKEEKLSFGKRFEKQLKSASKSQESAEKVFSKNQSSN